MKEIVDSKQVRETLGQKILKPKDVSSESHKAGLIQERHILSNENGISKGSYMNNLQTASLYNEVNDGRESREVTDNFNKKMGIAD